MPRQDGRLEAGQRLNGAISARAWNRALDAADIVLGDRYGVTADGPSYSSAPYTWVYGKNTTTEDVPRWGTVQISGLSSTPDDSLSQFESMPVLECVKPAANGLGRANWCVAIEPIKALSIGRVAVAGIVQAQVYVADSGKTVLRPRPGYFQLTTASFGQARAIYLDSDEEQVAKLSLIELGCPYLGPVNARFTGTWTKDTSKTVTIDKTESMPWETYSVFNGYFDAYPPTVDGGSYGYCSIISLDGCDAYLQSLPDLYRQGAQMGGQLRFLNTNGTTTTWKKPAVALTKTGEGYVTDVQINWEF